MKSLVVANWKMNPASPKEAGRLLNASADIASRFRRNVELVVCPPFVYLSRCRDIDISIGAQDCFWENPRGGGAYTGEISANMLKQNGARFVIIGHSERREYFGETNAVIAKKLAVALAAGLTPILCVGERERDAESAYLSFVKQEVEKGLSLVKKTQLTRVVIAYEPIWAIGTDERPIAPKTVLEMNLYIKKVLYGIWGKRASAIRIIYGGSVAPGYATQFLTEGGMTGLLVGHQSLKPKNLEKIVYEIANA
jgi:triosephosphate isomerase